VNKVVFAGQADWAVSRDVVYWCACVLRIWYKVVFQANGMFFFVTNG